MIDDIGNARARREGEFVGRTCNLHRLYIAVSLSGKDTEQIDRAHCKKCSKTLGRRAMIRARY